MLNIIKSSLKKVSSGFILATCFFSIQVFADDMSSHALTKKMLSTIQQSIQSIQKNKNDPTPQENDAIIKRCLTILNNHKPIQSSIDTDPVQIFVYMLSIKEIIKAISENKTSLYTRLNTTLKKVLIDLENKYPYHNKDDICQELLLLAHHEITNGYKNTKEIIQSNPSEMTLALNQKFFYFLMTHIKCIDFILPKPSTQFSYNSQHINHLNTLIIQINNILMSQLTVNDPRICFLQEIKIRIKKLRDKIQNEFMFFVGCHNDSYSSAEQ